MAVVRVTKKGQITIPKDVRQVKGIEPGSLLTIDIEGEEIVIRKVAESVVSGTVGIWAGRLDPEYYRELRKESEKRVGRLV